MVKPVPRVMIAGTGSGCGKTSVSCGIMNAIAARGIKIAPFKCGPDYIDPMFHEKAAETPSCNLDVYMCGESAVKRLLAEKSEGYGVSVIEGVMGFYDGITGRGLSSSSHELSVVTDTPVILVINGKGRVLSAAAEIEGFKNFAPNNIKGVIFNGVNPSSLELYKKETESRTGLKVFGCFPHIGGAAVESRRLGLVTAGEISDIKEKTALLGKAAEELDIDAVLDLASGAANLDYEPISPGPSGSCRIGVAYDKAFCFYYSYNMELLEKLGAELRFFSPLKDGALPEGISGLIFGGGYPELYAGELSGNRVFISCLKNAVAGGMPLMAECGGFMYLQDRFCGMPGAGIIPGSSRMTERLRRFGYIEMTAEKDNILCGKGDKIKAHEFHYSDSTVTGDTFRADKASGQGSWKCIYAEGSIFAGYPHIHFAGNEFLAENFMSACLKYGGL